MAYDQHTPQVMSREVFTVSPDTPIREAVKLFVEQRISGAPVVDSNNVLVGVLSESDLLWKEAGGPHDHFLVPPVYLGLLDTFIYVRDEKNLQQEMQKFLAQRVGEAMSTTLVTITEDAVLPTAADLMLTKKVNRLPVVDSDNKVIGLLTRSDVLRGMLGGACALF